MKKINALLMAVLIAVFAVFALGSGDTGDSGSKDQGSGAASNDEVYQNGVGLNGAYFLDDSANYNAENQTKEIKKGASIEVEVAYELNDTTTDIEVEVKELFSFDDTTITKTFSIT